MRDLRILLGLLASAFVFGAIGCSVPIRAFPASKVAEVNARPVSADAGEQLDGFLANHTRGWSRGGAGTPSNYIRVDRGRTAFTLGYRGNLLVRNSGGATYTKRVSASEVARLRDVIANVTGGGMGTVPPPEIEVPDWDNGGEFAGTPMVARGGFVERNAGGEARVVADVEREKPVEAAAPRREPAPDPVPVVVAVVTDTPVEEAGVDIIEEEDYYIPGAPNVAHPDGVPELNSELQYLQSIWPSESTLVSTKEGFSGKGGFVYTGVIDATTLRGITDKYYAKFGTRLPLRKFGW